MDKGVIAGEIIKLRDQWLLSNEPAVAVNSFVDFCVAFLVGGSDLGVCASDSVKIKEKFG